MPIIKGVGNNSSQSSGSILILVHSSIPHTSSQMNIFLHAQGVRISVDQKVTIYNLYILPHHFYRTRFSNSYTPTPNSISFRRRLQGSSPHLGKLKTKPKSNINRKYFLSNDISLLNNKQPTYVHPATGSMSSIDLALCRLCPPDSSKLSKATPK